MAKKVITVTLNTSIDAVINIDQFFDNSILNAKSFFLRPSGKGLNTARVLSTLGQEVLAIGIVGELTKAFFTNINLQFLKTDFIFAEGYTRFNNTILQASKNSSTHIRTVGFQVDEEIINKVKTKLSNYVRSGDIVHLAGSLPLGAEIDTYYTLVKLCKSKGAYVILDASGEEMIKGLSAKPDLIKPNIKELESILSEKIENDDHVIIDKILDLSKRNINDIAVSLGAGGILYYRKNSEYVLKASVDLEPEYRMQYAVGSGDSMIAGFIYGIVNQMDLKDMVLFGVSCGAANALSDLPGDSSAEKIKELINICKYEMIYIQ